MASGLFILVSRIMLEHSTDLKNIMVINQATSNVIQLIINDVLTKITIIGVILLVIGLVFSVIYNLLHKKYYDEIEK